MTPIMSAQNQTQDQDKTPLPAAHRAERELNNHAAKTGSHNSTDESGINESVETRFPNAHVTYGRGAGDGREIPEEEGGGVDIGGAKRMAKAGDSEGVGGPEEKVVREGRERGGDPDVVGAGGGEEGLD